MENTGERLRGNTSLVSLNVGQQAYEICPMTELCVVDSTSPCGGEAEEAEWEWDLSDFKVIVCSCCNEKFGIYCPTSKIVFCSDECIHYKSAIVSVTKETQLGVEVNEPVAEEQNVNNPEDLNQSPSSEEHNETESAATIDLGVERDSEPLNSQAASMTDERDNAITKTKLNKSESRNNSEKEDNETKEGLNSDSKSMGVKLSNAVVGIKNKETLITLEQNPIMAKSTVKLLWSTDPDDFFGELIGGIKSFENDPGDFFFQSFAMSKKSLQLQMDIYTFFLSAKIKPVDNLELNVVCFAPFGGDFFRAEIIEIFSSESCLVFFIDYGNTAKLPMTELVVMPNEFLRTDRLCFHCKWDKWLASDASTEDLLCLFNGPISVVPRMKICNGQYLVGVNDYKCTAEFNLKTHSNSFAEPSLESDVTDFAPPGAQKLPIQESKFSSTSQADNGISPREIFLHKDCVYSTNLVDGEMVTVCFIWGYTELMIQAVADVRLLMGLQTKIEEFVKDAKPLETCPAVNEVVLGAYDNEYYRALVTKVQDDTCSLSFLDYGDQTENIFNQIYTPNEEMMKCHIYGRKVLLDGVTEPLGHWKVDKKVNELVSKPLQLEITGRDDKDPSSLTVKLWDGEKLTLNSVLQKSYDDEK